MLEQRPTKLKKLPSRDNRDRPTRILYVEDTEVMRDTILRLLEVYGYQVAYAKNGQEGVEMTRRWKPDLVLMDLNMPVMNGYSATHEIRFSPETGHIPIIVISVWGGKKERDRAKLAGADDFFVKPPDINGLIETIERAVAASKQLRRSN